MILKIILFGALIYFLYKAFGGEFKLPQKKDKKVDKEDGDTLVECSKCSVFITKKEAIFKAGKYYCDECA